MQPNSTVVGIPGRVVAVKGVAVSKEEEEMLEHGHLPDPVGQMITSLSERVAALEAEIEEKKAGSAGPLAQIPGG